MLSVANYTPSHLLARLSSEALSKLCHHRPFIIDVFALIIVFVSVFVCVFVFACLSSEALSKLCHHTPFIIIVFALIIVFVFVFVRICICLSVKQGLV